MISFRFDLVRENFSTPNFALSVLATIVATACGSANNLTSEISQVDLGSSLPNYPSITITAPVHGAFVQSSLTMTAEAGGIGSIYSVEFYLDDVFQSRDDAAPFEHSLTNLSEGPHTVFARTRDYSGYLSRSTDVTFTVDQTSPDVSVTAPTNCSNLTGTAQFQINATDTSGVRNVRFFLDDIFLAADGQPPYEFNLETTTLTNGAHSLGFVAIDNALNIRRLNISCTIFNNKAPVVRITSPINGFEFTGPLQVTASASDDQSVSGVDFYGIYSASYCLEAQKI